MAITPCKYRCAACRLVRKFKTGDSVAGPSWLYASCTLVLQLRRWHGPAFVESVKRREFLKRMQAALPTIWRREKHSVLCVHKATVSYYFLALSCPCRTMQRMSPQGSCILDEAAKVEEDRLGVRWIPLRYRTETSHRDMARLCPLLKAGAAFYAFTGRFLSRTTGTMSMVQGP